MYEMPAARLPGVVTSGDEHTPAADHIPHIFVRNALFVRKDQDSKTQVFVFNFQVFAKQFSQCPDFKYYLMIRLYPR